MPPICLDHLTLPELTALELVGAGAALGCEAVSLFVTPLPLGPYRDLVEDRGALREVRAALAANGLGVGIVEPFMIDAAPDWERLRAIAGVAAVLGGSINALAFDGEPARLAASMRRLAGIAATEGLCMAIEGFSLSTVRTPAQALALAQDCGDHVGVTVDALHVMRTGGSWQDVAALPPERVFHVQLCDGLREVPADIGEEAIAGRLPPGRGEFCLESLVPMIPATARIAVESPWRDASLTPLERGRIAVDAARELLR